MQRHSAAVVNAVWPSNDNSTHCRKYHAVPLEKEAFFPPPPQLERDRWPDPSLPPCLPGFLRRFEILFSVV